MFGYYREKSHVNHLWELKGRRVNNSWERTSLIFVFLLFFCFVLFFWFFGFFFYILYIHLVINVLVQTVEAGQYSYNPSVAVSVKSANRKVVPTIWKTADVIPMYKEDEETDKRNYLGISLLSAPGKLMESTETSTPNVLATSPNFILSKLTVWCRHNFFAPHLCKTVWGKLGTLFESA